MKLSYHALAVQWYTLKLNKIIISNIKKLVLYCVFVQVMYCGEHCRLEASVLYHRTECEFSQFLDKNIFDIFDVLVLRTFLVGTKQGKHLEKYRKNENFQNLFGEKPQYSSSEKYKSDYLSIYNLHINLKNYPQLTIRIYRSAIMLHLLKQSSFFNDVYLEIDEVSFNFFFLCIRYL